MKQTKFRNAGIFLLLLSVLCICIGFYKMFVYENGEYSWSSHKNVYVGGDAYNFIINGTYATAFFVLGIGGMISGMLCLIGDGIIVTLQENGNNYTRKDGMAKVTETAKMQEVPVMPVQSNAAKVEAEAEEPKPLMPEVPQSEPVSPDDLLSDIINDEDYGDELPPL